MLKNQEGRQITLAEAEDELTELRAEAEDILSRAGDNDLADDEARRFDSVTGRAQQLREFVADTNAKIERGKQLVLAGSTERGDGCGSVGGRSRTADPPKPPELRGIQVLNRKQSVSHWVRDNARHQDYDDDVSFDRYMRGIVTGNWDDAPKERALAEGTNSAGGFVVPSPIASKVIDLARNSAQVINAGAQTVPMTSQTLRLPRLEGEGTPAWRNENAAVAEADLVFGAVTLTARSLTRLVKISRELFEDSDPSVSDIVSQAFAAQIALELDRVALRGSGTAPEPRGVLNTSGVTVTAHGANGATATYDFLLDALGAVLNANFAPTAIIGAPRLATTLGKLKDSTGNYLAAPQGLPPVLLTKQVPTNLTVGTSTDTSEVYTADWTKLAIGIRTGFTLEVLRERYADNMQLGFLAHLRADVAVLQPSAFHIDTGVR
ncbi:phage major capsid protein [Nocardia sp. NPDC051750]|uniref:phage major capsid protein n=1 Tax=Nocardia sp. NPDC051750 TaxID=3364325 RepID=UPI0037BA5E1B